MGITVTIKSHTETLIKKTISALVALTLIFFTTTSSAQTQAQAATNINPKVRLTTDLGDIVVLLYQDKAPITVKNFLDYVDSGYYNGLIFHRVKPNFVVQGGGLTFDYVRKAPNAPIKNESANGLKNTTGTLAMARHSDPDSATSQFFINMKHNKTLNHKKNKPGYTVFGRVMTGMGVALRITKEPRGMIRAFPEAPNVPIRILKAERI